MYLIAESLLGGDWEKVFVAPLLKFEIKTPNINAVAEFIKRHPKIGRSKSLLDYYNMVSKLKKVRAIAIYPEDIGENKKAILEWSPSLTVKDPLNPERNVYIYIFKVKKEEELVTNEFSEVIKRAHKIKKSDNEKIFIINKGERYIIGIGEPLNEPPAELDVFYGKILKYASWDGLI